MNITERVINGLYGQAVADAVGNPFEFHSCFDSSLVSKYANDSKVLVVSDDTQMTIFGFEAVLTYKSYQDNLEVQIKNAFTKAYTNWYITQTRDFHHTRVYNKLLTFKSLFSIQAPGGTCLSALKAIRDGKPVENNSKGCGSVMRLLPLVYLLKDHNLETVIRCAKISGSITHLHEENYRAIEKYIVAAYNLVNDKPIIKIDTDKISKIGKGWTAMECVNMAIWAYNNASTYDELLELSIGHDGDSDSVGAIAGSLWGLSGKDVPIKYVVKLDALDAINYIREQL